MMWAENVDGERIAATQGAFGSCPACGARLQPKCGELVAWHWAHRACADCDPWAEHESEWHLGWKTFLPRENTEVVMGSHRADIVTPRGCVVELQHSSIAPAEIRERERFYQRMVWLFDAGPFVDHLTFRRRDAEHRFRWRWPRRSLGSCSKPMFWDLRDGRIFEVTALELGPREIRHNGHVVDIDAATIGWGRMHPAAWFIDRLTRTTPPERFVLKRITEDEALARVDAFYTSVKDVANEQLRRLAIEASVDAAFAREARHG